MSSGAQLTTDLVAADVMSTPVVVVGADDTVASAWSTLLRHGMRHVVVIEGAMCAGVLDDRVLAMSRADVGMPVADLIAARTTCVFETTPLQHVAGVMVRDRVDAVPVVRPDGAVVGLVTARDVLAVVAAAGGVRTDLRIEMPADPSPADPSPADSQRASR